MNLECEINQLLETIDVIINGILVGKEVEPVKLFPKLMEQVGQVFPVAVEMDENSGVWMDLLGRISTALESEDCFEIVDILYYEVRGNLISFMQRRLQHG